jgi:tRNA-dihydrouridine synthase B
VMIGRAAATNPWIFSQMVEFRETGIYTQPTDADRHQLLSRYYKEIKLADQPDAVGKMKQFACWFTHGVGNGSELRRTVHEARTPGEVLDAVERFFERQVNVVNGPDAAVRNEERSDDATEHARLETAG